MDAERILNDTYRFVNIGILVKSSVGEQGNIIRRIEQIGAFDRSGDSYLSSTNQIVVLVDQGQITGEELPKNLRRRFEENGLVVKLGAAKPFTNGNGV